MPLSSLQVTLWIMASPPLSYVRPTSRQEAQGLSTRLAAFAEDQRGDERHRHTPRVRSIWRDKIEGARAEAAESAQGEGDEMEYEFIRVDREERVTLITLNRPQAMNALCGPMHWELHHAFDAFDADPDQWVAILTGAGERAFSAGSDLKEMAQKGPKKAMPASGYGGIVERFDLDKPVIAAVNGVAAGGGFEVALACDLIIAADTARFGLPEPKVGLAAAGGGLLKLPRQIPLKQAMGMILTGRLAPASEALALGFVNEVAPAADLLTVARRWAAQICECSPLAIRASKQVAMRGLDLPMEEALHGQRSLPALLAMNASEDAREGPLAFSEKRTPRWTGR
jgi:crotonobetainyl-CoA hydratase